MKIMHIGQLIGGLDVYIRNSVAYLNDEFIDFVIIHGKDDKSRPVIRNNNIVKEYTVSLSRSLNFWKDLLCLIQVIKLIVKERPDKIHCHSAKGGMIGRVAGLLTQTKTFYTPHAFSFLSSSSKLKYKIFLFLERITRFNSYLLACSESERQMGIKLVGYKEERALVWHNSVPDASWKHGKIEVTKEHFISYIGRPCYQKNPFFLLDVIRKVMEVDSSIKFYLLGVGYHSPYLEEMQKRISELHIEDNIILQPWLLHDDCLEYVRKSMFYLTVSLYEGLPLSVIEAMSLGKAVVASDVTGNKDCVINGVNGYLLPFDADVFAQKILELLKNEDRRKTFEINSRKIYLSKFQIEKQIFMLQTIYRRR